MNENMIIPDNISRKELDNLFKEFMNDDEYDSKQFFKYFKNRKALMQIPVPSLMDYCKNSICYDERNQIDLRMAIMLVHQKDKKLFIDVSKHVLERFQNKPASQLTLMQYKAVLARRLYQVGF